MYRNIGKRLQEEYGWSKLGELEGVVRVGSESPGGKSSDLSMSLPANHEFSKDIKSIISLEEPAEFKRLLIVVEGPDIIYFMKPFLEKAFCDLSFGISIGDKGQEVVIVEEGKVNAKDMILMGEIREFMMYVWKRWSKVGFGQADIVPVNLRIHGKTGIPRNDIGFILRLYTKIESVS